jgi:hypothetical protein
MALTNDQQLDIQSTGAADWDTGLGSNFQILERGHHFIGIAGSAINTGDAIVQVNSLVYPYDGSSLNLGPSHGLSYKSVTSGSQTQFLGFGVVRSLSVFSGNIVSGERIYASANSIGMLVSSYSASDYPIGFALDINAVYINPGIGRPIPEQISVVNSSGVLVGSYFDFSVDLGNRGIIRNIQVVANSLDAYKVRFWSGSARAAGELLFETVTTSVDGGASDYDIQSLSWVERLPWAFEGTDTSTPGLIFGRVDAQSASNVGSDTFGITVTGDRFR